MFSQNDGKKWKDLKAGLPTVCVNDLIVKNNDLVMATQGRSLWVLDDFSPLRSWTKKVTSEPLHIFEPEQATRWHIAGGFSFDTGVEIFGTVFTIAESPKDKNILWAG